MALTEVEGKAVKVMDWEGLVEVEVEGVIERVGVRVILAVSVPLARVALRVREPHFVMVEVTVAVVEREGERVREGDKVEEIEPLTEEDSEGEVEGEAERLTEALGH